MNRSKPSRKSDPAEQVLVLQAGGEKVSDIFLDPFGIEMGRDYILVNSTDVLVEKVRPAARQLILTSHTKHINGFDAAVRAKRKSPGVTVFAFTGSVIPSTEGSMLDGVIPKMGLSVAFISELILLFKDGASREVLVERVRSLHRPGS